MFVSYEDGKWMKPCSIICRQHNCFPWAKRINTYTNINFV